MTPNAGDETDLGFCEMTSSTSRLRVQTFGFWCSPQGFLQHCDAAGTGLGPRDVSVQFHHICCRHHRRLISPTVFNTLRLKLTLQ